jgi:hypothetical protein
MGFQYPCAGLYTAFKHAVLGLAEVFRDEAPPNVTVSILCPGLVATDLGSSRLRPEGITRSAPQTKASQMVRARGTDPADAAKHTLDRVVAGDSYIVTHAHAVRPAKRRYNEIASAFAAIVGVTKRAQFTDAVGALEVSLSTEQIRALEAPTCRASSRDSPRRSRSAACSACFPDRLYRIRMHLLSRANMTEGAQLLSLCNAAQGNSECVLYTRAAVPPIASERQQSCLIDSRIVLRSSRSPMVVFEVIGQLW